MGKQQTSEYADLSPLLPGAPAEASLAKVREAGRRRMAARPSRAR